MEVRSFERSQQVDFRTTHQNQRWWFPFRVSTPALMIMILFRNYPLSFTEWKRAICAAVVPENGIISLLIMMTYDFHCQIC